MLFFNKKEFIRVHTFETSRKLQKTLGTTRSLHKLQKQKPQIQRKVNSKFLATTVRVYLKKQKQQGFKTLIITTMSQKKTRINKKIILFNPIQPRLTLLHMIQAGLMRPQQAGPEIPSQVHHSSQFPVTRPTRPSRGPNHSMARAKT